MMEQNFGRILLALDNSNGSKKVIAQAKTLINSLQTNLALLTVTPVTAPANFGADPLLGQQPIVLPDVSNVQQETAQQFLEGLRAEFSAASQVEIFNQVGDVRDEILATATEWAADLIIMGTNGRSGFDHFISGSVAESVIRKSTCPVLVIPVGEEED